MLYANYHFKVYFFKIFVIHIFLDNLVPKSEGLQIDWNLVQGYYITIYLLRFYCLFFQNFCYSHHFGEICPNWLESSICIHSSSLWFENASSVKWNVILQKKTCLSRNINGIYFHLNLTTTFSLQINILVIIESFNFSRFSCSKYYGQILFHLVFSKLSELHCDTLIANLIFIFSIFFAL